MSRACDLAVFDFDGTLVDSNAIKSGGFDEIASRYRGGPEAMQQARAVPGADRHAVAVRFADLLGLPEGAAARIVQDYTHLVDGRVAGAPAIAGATDLLDGLLDAGIPSHLSSATPLRSLQTIVAARGWERYFTGLHGRPAIKPETLRRLIAERGVSPDRVVVVGDGEDDLASASECGVRFIPVGDRLDGVRHTLDEVREVLLS